MWWRQVKIWNFTRWKYISTIQAHKGLFVQGVCTHFCGTSFFYCWWWQNCQAMENGWTKLWRRGGTTAYNTRKDSIYRDWSSLDKSCFATCGQQVDTWDEQITNPICSMTWGFDRISSLKFNPTETLLLWSCSDRNIALYDMRKASPLKKVILDMRTNTIFWNPLEAFVFTAAKITAYILLICMHWTFL